MSRVRIAHVTRLRAGFGILKQSGTAEFFVSRLQRRKIPFFMTIEGSQSVHSIVVYCEAMLQSPCIHETLGIAVIIREKGKESFGYGNHRKCKRRDPADQRAGSGDSFFHGSFFISEFPGDAALPCGA